MSHTVGETKITAYGADRIALCARDLDANGGKAIALLYGPDRLANAHLFQSAPDLLEFVQQIFNGIDTGMITIDTPADETLANILSRGRKALSKATGDA